MPPTKRQPFEKITEYVEFAVTGRGDFPVDMLRYDMCWPATDAESIAVAHRRVSSSVTGWEGYDDTAAVHLRGIKYPTERRWESFGWKVVPGSLYRGR